MRSWAVVGGPPFPADWNKHGKAAGAIRNRQMMSEGKPTLVVFFHNNLRQSRGTRDMVEVAVKNNVPVINGWSVPDWPRALELYQELDKTRDLPHPVQNQPHQPDSTPAAP